MTASSDGLADGGWERPRGIDVTVGALGSWSFWSFSLVTFSRMGRYRRR